MLSGRFTVDGVDLYDIYKFIVEKADGLDVLPKPKKRTTYDWADESGVEVDPATDLVFESMGITLTGRVVGNSYSLGMSKVNALLALISKDGFHLLKSGFRNKVYPVLLEDSTAKPLFGLTRQEVVIDLTLKLTCPFPERRQGAATVTALQAVAVRVDTGKEFSVWWGDGSMDKGFNELTHEYQAGNTYPVLVAGTGITWATFDNDSVVMED